MERSWNKNTILFLFDDSGGGSLSDFSRMRSASVRFIAHTFFCVFYQVQSEKKY